MADKLTHCNNNIATLILETFQATRNITGVNNAMFT